MTTIAQLIASHKAALTKMREMEAGPNAPDYDAAVEAESTAFETLARARSGSIEGLEEKLAYLAAYSREAPEEEGRLEAPATFWALALHSRMTLAEPSRNWIRYCIVNVELGDDARPRHVTHNPRSSPRRSRLSRRLAQFAERWVVQYNFYVNDERWGRMFVRMCPYLPFSARVCLNQHHWLANWMREEGVDFHQRSNAFMGCAGPSACGNWPMR